MNVNYLGIGWFLWIVSNAGYTQGIHAYNSADKDTNTIKHFFENGRFYGHARSYSSATINQKALSNYYAWGVGAGIGYETPVFLKHFQFGLSGFFILNVASSDLAKADTQTGQSNRYEIGLFDIERPDYRKDLNRLEELFLKTHFGKKSVLTIGRQIPQSPFINPQDGRMSPTLVEGAVLEVNEGKHWKLHGEYLWRISPRSTVRWMNVGESIGVYPVGVDVNGKPSLYKNQVQSNYVGIWGTTYQTNHWNVQLWDTYLDNVLNTAFAKTEWKSTPVGGRNWLAGGQVVRQDAVGNGGNTDASKAYTQPGSRAWVFSGRFGKQSPKFDWFLNATRITAGGRYLLPREWGREPFYTFLPRERNEGFGDVTAATLNTFYKPQKNIKIELSGGLFQLPDAKNATLNKYGMPGYSQVNLGITYQFERYLKGLNALLLIVRKDEQSNTYNNDRYVFNKVNMTHLNFILNYLY
ncbi:MAG: OprD family outer membrane porin [Spirosomataceae bacterium]